MTSGKSVGRLDRERSARNLRRSAALVMSHTSSGCKMSLVPIEDKSSHMRPDSCNLCSISSRTLCVHADLATPFLFVTGFTLYLVVSRRMWTTSSTIISSRLPPMQATCACANKTASPSCTGVTARLWSQKRFIREPIRSQDVSGGKRSRHLTNVYLAFPGCDHVPFFVPKKETGGTGK